MEEIIKQIAQIDSVAVSNKENSEQALKDRREQLLTAHAYYFT